MANTLVLKRLTSIQQTLNAAYDASQELSEKQSAIKGTEREIFVASFLREMFPPQFRFGSGVITDANENTTGQLDIVIELPFAPSFTLGNGAPRVYLADTVGAVIEVKSDLSDQWSEIRKQLEGRDDAQSSFKALKQIKRRVIVPTGSGDLIQSETIPAYAVGYRGFKTLKALVDRMKAANGEYVSWLRGALIVGDPTQDGPSLFAGNDGKTKCEGPEAIGAFINSLHWELHRATFPWDLLLSKLVPARQDAVQNPVDLRQYFGLCQQEQKNESVTERTAINARGKAHSSI